MPNNKLPLIVGLVVVAIGVFVFVIRKPVVAPTNEQTNQQIKSQPSPVSESSESATTSTAVKEFKIGGTNFKFDLTEIKVKKGDRVRVVFTSNMGFHSFVIDELNVKTADLGSGKSETVEFTADTAGTFEYYCSVGNHRQMGMVGKLTVE